MSCAPGCATGKIKLLPTMPRGIRAKMAQVESVFVAFRRRKVQIRRSGTYQQLSKSRKAAAEEKHHLDYTKPLEVVWACRKCHLWLHNSGLFHTQESIERIAEEWDMRRKQSKRYLRLEFQRRKKLKTMAVKYRALKKTDTVSLGIFRCGKCGADHTRRGQRHCAPCHAAAQRKHRAIKTRMARIGFKDLNAALCARGAA